MPLGATPGGGQAPPRRKGVQRPTTLEDRRCEKGHTNGGAGHRHTLNTLDLLKEDGLSQNATGDQLRGDIFFRVNQSLQHFFDLSAQLDTVFE